MSNNKEDPGFETRTQHVREHFRKLMNPPPPQWQAEPPTEPGFYWIRREGERTVVEVTEAASVLFHGNEVPYGLIELGGCAFWTVAIQPPPLPEAGSGSL